MAKTPKRIYKAKETPTKADAKPTAATKHKPENAQEAINEAHAAKQPKHRKSADDGAAALRRVPQHPVKPNAFGSAPEPTSVPTGVQGEQVVYITDDIAADGTPLIQPKATPQDIAKPSFNGETSADMPADHVVTETEQAATDEPVIVSTEDGAVLERMKQPGKTVVVEPKVEDLHEGGVVPAGDPDKNRV